MHSDFDPPSVDQGIAKGQDHAWRCLRKFNSPTSVSLPTVRKVLRTKAMLVPWLITDWFAGDTFIDRLARVIAERRCVVMKEFCESLEFFELVRKGAKAPVVADLCGGHGLTGLLFAALERKVDKVIILDISQPLAFERLLGAVSEICPWVADKVEYVQSSVKSPSTYLPKGCSVVAIHACRDLTDHSIKKALEADARYIAVMPCCYGQPAKAVPDAAVGAIGRGLAEDIHRTYTLEKAGYAVRWAAIPSMVTPRNRVLISTRLSERPTLG